MLRKVETEATVAAEAKAALDQAGGDVLKATSIMEARVYADHALFVQVMKSARP